MANGGKLWVDEIYSGKNTDGYRWMKTHNIKSGYSQMDLNVMHPVGKPLGNAQIRLTGSAARIRTKVVDGAVLTTIENGDTFIVQDFLPNKASDGYRWMKVLYSLDESRTGTGYAQFDPNVMYPYTTSGVAEEITAEDQRAEQSSGENLHAQLTGSAAAIRQYAVKGTILETVPNGGKVWVDGLYYEKNSDGYRWMKTHNNKTGYSQYDPNVMHLVGKPSGITLVGRADADNVTLHERIGGTAKRTLRNGETFEILDFLPNQASDGYRYMKVSGGFIRYDKTKIFTYSHTGKPSESAPVVNSVKMVLTGSAARLRNDVQGTVLVTAPNGSSIQVQDFYDWKASDQYRWCWGSYGGYNGAFQYDPAVMHPEGTTSRGLLKMKLEKSAARLRSAVQGTVLLTVPVGGEIYITEFLSGKASDGYYWCRGTYNGTSGYFQYDPAVMFPYGNV